MNETEFQNIVEQLERIATNQGSLKIDVVARLARLKQGLSIELDETRKNTDGDEEPAASSGRNAALRA